MKWNGREVAQMHPANIIRSEYANTLEYLRRWCKEKLSEAQEKQDTGGDEQNGI